MANFCSYEVHVKGHKSATMLVYASMPALEEKVILFQNGNDDDYELHFEGACKWSVNFGVDDSSKPKVNVSEYDEQSVFEEADKYYGISLRAKSECFDCEILVHYWSEESGFDQFDHYKNGQVVKKRKIAYSYDDPNVFDWDKTEFIGHENEYDESVDGEAQDTEFMNRILGLFGAKQTQPESEADDDHDEKINDIVGRVDQLITEIQGFAKGAGIDLFPSSIGDTGYDLYKWSFKEGKTVKGNCWQVAVPDGFEVVESNEGRIFEIVPMGMKGKDKGDIPVRILPGADQQTVIGKDSWAYHVKARAGYASLIAVKMAQMYSSLLSAPDILTIGFDDCCAMCLTQDTGGNSFSFQCLIMNDKHNQALRVQTQYVTDEQKKDLDQSIISWMETFRYDDRNQYIPKHAWFDNQAAISDLKKGKTSSFEKEVDGAVEEYKYSVAGPLQQLHYFSDNGFLEDGSKDLIRKSIKDSLEVLEFYFKKADDLVQKAVQEKIDSETMEKVYKKLFDEFADKNNYFTSIHYENEPITENVPSSVTKTIDKWATAYKNIQIVNKEAAKIKEEEEKKKREAEEKTKKDMYAAASANLLRNDLKSVESAAKDFKTLAGYRDSKAKLKEADKKAADLKVKNEIDNYQKNLSDVIQRRERLLNDSVNREKERLNRLAQNQFDSIKKSGNAEIDDLAQKKNNAQKELEQQGFFAFGKKSELKTAIRNCEIGIEKKKKEIEEAEKVYNDTLQANKQKISNFKEKEQKRIEEENPLPQKPDGLSRQIMMMIYDYMSKTGKSYTVKELYGVFKDYVSSEKEFSSIITKMRNNILISREVVYGTAYFRAI